MQPYRQHRTRMAAPPICLTGGTVYREATEEELAAAYAETFPDGPKPIATFRADNPDDVARLKSVIGPDALQGIFGPGGGGIPAFMAAMEAAGAAPTGGSSPAPRPSFPKAARRTPAMPGST